MAGRGGRLFAAGRGGAGAGRGGGILAQATAQGDVGMTLKERLTKAGITLTEGEGSPALDTPWFVRVLQAFSGWLAALFLLGFIALGAVFVLDNEGAAAALGLMLIAAAFATLQWTKSDFLEHMALAVSLVGQLLMAWAVFSLLLEEVAVLWWTLLVLQVVLALVMPSLTHRVFS